MKNKKFIVLGANGYIGRHMVGALRKNGLDVLAADVQSGAVIDGTPFKQIDICDKKAVESADFSCDFIIFFSGITGTYSGFDNYEQYFNVNEIGLANVLNSLRKYPKKPRIIFPSSRLVYKGKDGLLKEEDELEAKTIYAINKISCENLLKAYENSFGIPYTVFRICVPYANLFDDNYSFGTIGFFLKKAKSGQPIVLYGDGSLRRTFTHIEDVCAQLLSAGTHPDSVNSTYNVSGEEFSLREVAGMFAKRFNIEVQFSPWHENDLRIESGHTVFNSKKIERLLHKPIQYHLKEWIAKL